ncbi:nuclease [Blautia schinkii]|nr:nuclease [Blautia schinkii]
MDYIKEGRKPPKSKNVITKPQELARRLKPLIGQKIPMTGKSRTDGSHFRKMITNHLLSEYLPEEADEYEIVPPRQKGVPAFLREYIDTYIVTTGNLYNLQVWNRNPNSASVQVDLKNGENLLASDVRFVLGKINADKCIESIVIMTPDYIERKFGKFGRPTVKQQLIISNKRRTDIINDGGMVITDSSLPEELLAQDDTSIGQNVSIKDEPDKVLPIKVIDERISDKLIGEKLNIALSTKQRGQQLERMVAHELGYKNMQGGLEGGYPDIRNQMLEVKVQDSPTIDLGKFSPQFEEPINAVFTTRTIRYLIALTNSMNGEIDGLILCPGGELGKHFTYVADKSFKCQRSIPMSFFDEFKGQVVFNP